MDKEQDQQSPEMDKEKMNDVREQFVSEAMELASGKQYDKMIMMAKSSKDRVQGFARALFFVLDSIRKRMNNNGATIPSRLWLAENGIISQVAKLVAVLVKKEGIDITTNDIEEGIEVAARQLAQSADDEDNQLMGEIDEDIQAQQPQEQPQQGGMLPPQQGAPQ